MSLAPKAFVQHPRAAANWFPARGGQLRRPCYAPMQRLGIALQLQGDSNCRVTARWPTSKPRPGRMVPAAHLRCRLHTASSQSCCTPKAPTACCPGSSYAFFSTIPLDARMPFETVPVAPCPN